MKWSEKAKGKSRCASKQREAREERRKWRFVPRPTHYRKPLFILSFKYLPRWPSVTLGNKTPYWCATHAPPTNVYLRCNDEDDNENVKKAIGLISKTTTSHVHHTFLYISFPLLHDCDVKMPNFAFYGGRRQATTIYFSFWAWIWSLENSTSGGFAYNWQSKWVGIIAIKTERTEIHFFSDVLVAVASLDLKVPSTC